MGWMRRIVVEPLKGVQDEPLQRLFLMTHGRYNSDKVP